MDNSLHWLEPVHHTVSPPLNVTLWTPERDIPVFHTDQHEELMGLKAEIDKIQPVQIWDTAKKLTNPYEYIFLSLQKRTHRSIASVIPLSRSYFKMIELWDLLKLPVEETFLTSHSAEGPGGFLEAILHQIHPKKARMVAMTLRSTEKTIPGWRKSAQFLSTYPNVLITYGADNTGNLYSLENQAAFASTAKTHLGSSAMLYTADGGFDFSADFNAQETTVLRLLAAEGLCGLNSLQVGGTMILKLFDTKHAATLDLLWILSGCFEASAMTKPLTSRPANSERYWIGSKLRQSIPSWVFEILKTLTALDAPNGWAQIFKDPPYSAAFLEPLKAFQIAVETQQIHNIQLTLNLIKQPSRSLVYNLLLANIRSSRLWCICHQVAINRQYTGISDEQIANSNLEEALEPFQASVARTNLLGLSRPLPMHHVLSSSPSQQPPAGPAWRSALPASILGREPLKIVSETPPSNDLD